jgi:hypothetical protein
MMEILREWSLEWYAFLSQLGAVMTRPVRSIYDVTMNLKVYISDYRKCDESAVD